MNTPTVFLSAASDDLRDWRDVLHKAFSRAGCMVFTQNNSLGASAGDVMRLLRQHLDKSDFVIHLAGLAYGTEPEQPAFPSHPTFRCSYTQFEYYYAHQKGTQVIAFVCAPNFPYLPFTEKAADDADRERRRQLQLAHRERVAEGRFTGTPLDGKPHRPLCEPIADVNKLLQAVAAAVGTIHDCSQQHLLDAQAELESVARKRHEELLAYISDLPSRLADELERRRLVKPVFEFQADISRILKYAPAQLIGREEETKLLNDAWNATLGVPPSGGSVAPNRLKPGHRTRPHILTFVALGGEGKTSLVAKWAAELAAQDWPGCDAAFAWSFYSQGTREQQAASSDLFLKAALTFFGDAADKAFAASPAGAFEKGQRLARLVGQRRSLLILDGLEPLQYAPTAPTPGELKDQGLAALLQGLAAASHGLCVVTTRYSLPDLKAFWQTTAPEVKLLRLSRDAGVHLLKTLGVNGTAKEFETLVEDVKGHALTLTLLGGFLKRACHGDIRQRDRVKFEKADEKMDGGHAFRTMAAYEQWLLRDGGDEGRREVAVLRLMGLFDRPADAGCLAALRGETILGLTEPLAGLADDDWEFCLSGLEAAKLLTVNRDASGALVSLDAHPHIREYFAKQLREGRAGSPLPAAGNEGERRARSDAPYQDGWRAAHRRLYEHLCASTPDKPQPTLEDLQPLYQAVAHGCQAGLQQDALYKVYHARIKRRDENYSSRKLGVFGSDLGAVVCFFEQPWNRLSASLKANEQSWMLNKAAFRLRALGRLAESLEPMRVSGEMDVKVEEWKGAAISYSNLSELELTLGEVAGAVGDAEQSMTYADRSGDAFQRMGKRTTHADALHQAGRRAEAETRLREAEQMQQEDQPDYPLLYSLPGFRYCDLLLAAPERAAWQICLGSAGNLPAPVGDPPTGTGASVHSPSNRPSTTSAFPVASGRLPDATGRLPLLPLLESCRAVSQRAAQTLKWEEGMQGAPLLDFALHHLTLGRAALYEAILSARSSRGNEAPSSQSAFRIPHSAIAQSLLTSAATELDAAVAGLRRAGQAQELPRGLLTRAWLRFLTGVRTGPESAQEDLDEAWEIAERGPMKLFLADIHLYRARLFGMRNSECGVRNEQPMPYPWTSPQADLAAARQLIESCGYGRRKEELGDAEKVIGVSP
ncbi:MAG: DUF4062 domain-containing protein [Verrucomicrobia bacterium]|nr:DUF4062 domain-containing protein [Verrucomicrobiota bacterium]